MIHEISGKEKQGDRRRRRLLRRIRPMRHYASRKAAIRAVSRSPCEILAQRNSGSAMVRATRRDRPPFRSPSMHRVTITLDDDLMAELDHMIEERGYQNRSEAIRDFARAGMQQAAQDAGNNGDCVAALVYVY